MAWGDPSILRQIVKESRNIRDPHARNVFLRAAVQTGIVESGGKNLSHGDRDSLGWRQERTSIYGPSATNVPASVRRFRQEFQQFYRPGRPSYEIAARVQRPAAQYRGRYREVAAEAAALLRGQGAVGAAGAGGSGGGGGSSGGGGPLATVSGGETPARTIGQGSEGIVALLQSMQKQASQPPSGSLEAPEFSAGPVTPAGYKGLATSGGPAADKPDVSELIGALQGTGQTITRPGVPGVSTTIGGTPSTTTGGGGATPTAPVTAGGSYAGTAGIAQTARRVAAPLGLTVSSAKRDTKSTATGGISDHWVGKTNAYAYDLGNGVAHEDAAKLRAAQRIARAYGVNFVKDSYQSGGTVKVGGKRFRVQILYGGGVDHADHVHVGIERR